MQSKNNDEEYYRLWAEEYLESARNVKERIDVLKKKAKDATPNELAVLNNNIEILKSSYYDCKEVASILLIKARREHNRPNKDNNVGKLI